MKIIYLDNAATTKAYPEVLDSYLKANEDYFNPSALYGQSVSASVVLKNKRAEILKYLRAPEGELYFTSGGTESDNWSLFCTKKAKNGRIIVGEGEHDAIVNPAKELAMQGYDVKFAPIKTDGSIDEVEFEKLLTDNTTLVSIMHVSNETGAVNDIAKLVKMTKKHSPSAVFHSDGVQALGKVKVNLRALGVDLYSISGHKIHAPKGIGALYVKKGTSIRPLLFGGGQEYGMRSGTENLPMIVAFTNAIEMNMASFDENYSKKSQYLEYLKGKILENLPNTVVITPDDNHAPNILTVAFQGVRGEVLLHSLEKHGILVGIGSACSSHHESRFKSLLGLDENHRDGIVRFSVSQFNDIDEVDFVVEKIVEEMKVLVEYARK